MIVDTEGGNDLGNIFLLLPSLNPLNRIQLNVGCFRMKECFEEKLFNKCRI